MRFSLRRCIATAAATVLSIGMAIPASATGDDFGFPNDPPQVIEGGSVQHDDPSAYNFVPSPNDPNYVVIPELAQQNPKDMATPLDAFGVTNISSVTIKGVRVPTTTLSHSITGKGTTIQREYATLVSLNRICNYRVDFQNRYGNTIYHTETTNTRWRCDSRATVYSRLTSARPGNQCARLFISGVFVGEQCHQITK